MPVVNFDSSLLLGFYQSKLIASSATTSSQTAANSAAGTASSSKKSATANDVTPWSLKQAGQEARDAQVLGLKNFVDLSKVPILAGQSTDTKTEQDNQKLFALYTAVNNLSYLATMSKRDDTSAGQMAGYDARFQTGLQQIQDFIGTAKFNNFTLQAAAPSSSVTSTATVPLPTFGYTTGSIVSAANLTDPLSGVSTGDSFTVSVKKAGITTDVAIDLSKVSGGLTLDNIVKYVNQQLAANGFGTRLKRVITEGTIDEMDEASYGIQINNAGSEAVTLSSSQATASLYVSATSGLTAATEDSGIDSQGRLLKLDNLTDPQSEFSSTVAPSNGTTTATATVVDSSGNVYMLGNATGDFGSQINAGEQDVYLTKVDSAGTTLWTRMVGSAGTASGASLALNPNGGVTLVGTTDAKLTTTAVANGNQDSFVTRYDANGTQVWTTQIQTLNRNQAAAVSVASDGSVYIGGQTTGAIGAGQVKIGGSDAYLIKLDNKGKIATQQTLPLPAAAVADRVQFGTTGNDTVSATALNAAGDLFVASVQDGQAVLSKYAGGDILSAPAWQLNLGAIQNGGAITGLAVSNDKIYVAGSTSNPALTAATIAKASSGGSEAFVLAATDNGATATSDRVSYIGTAAIDKGGAVTVGADGTVYLTGSTTGTFAGQTRNAADTSNMFVAALAGDGSLNWVRQYGGLDGQSVGTGIAIDTQGSSVLDALGLPRGTIAASQSSDLLSATTLRPGDTFKVAIDSTSDRTFTVTIDKGETLQSLVTKLNGQLYGAGKASVVYTGGAAALKIEVRSGVTAKLISGPANSDALARLGIAPGTLSNGSTTTSASSSAQSFGLGLSSRMDISSSVSAGAARAQLINVLSAIQKAYQTTNTTPAASTASSGSSGAASAYAQSQVSNYSLALNILGGSSTSLLG
jgi:hypothetical protein